ncbi:hypothetical protein LINGRAHAP2_LOCUS16153 [Linum grandiflorum]
MSSTVFIAVQCCQCSTMQAKQKKKSSNKWTCVICNQKQSVIKVFAQSYMAKDIRQFVQSFNMSRKYADEQASPEEHEVTQQEPRVPVSRKRRVDWSEYLDPADYKPQETLEDGDEGGDIMVSTEMPKNARLRNGAYRDSDGDGVGDGSRFHNQASLKKKTNEDLEKASQLGVMKLEPKELSDIERLTDSRPKCNKETRTCQLPMTTKASMWDEYMNNDEDEWPQGSKSSVFACNKNHRLKQSSIPYLGEKWQAWCKLLGHLVSPQQRKIQELVCEQ